MHYILKLLHELYSSPCLLRSSKTSQMDTSIDTGQDHKSGLRMPNELGDVPLNQRIPEAKTVLMHKIMGMSFSICINISTLSVIDVSSLKYWLILVRAVHCGLGNASNAIGNNRCMNT